MIEDINEKVSVSLAFDAKERSVRPYLLKWHGDIKKITKVGYHHRFMQGKVLQHVFTVSDGTMTYRLRLDTDSLHWTLERISDGNAR